jgi:ribosomal protein L37AE/L43A
VFRTPDRVAAALDRDQLRLYTLIWQRTVATQMAYARFNQVGVDIDAVAGAARYRLRATGRTMIFDGHLRVYAEGRDDAADEDGDRRPPAELTADQLLSLLELLPEQHFTQPPPRFSEASLVKTLEELGIGRPSTYASIISTIQDRGYVRLEDRRFFPNDVGEVVTDKLVEHFPDIVNVNFTAEMEEDLDEIAEGDLQRVQVLRDFYGPFSEALDRAEEKFERYVEELDEECRAASRRARPARHGCRSGSAATASSSVHRFAEEDGGCKYIRNLDGRSVPSPRLLDETCPECGRPLAAQVRPVRAVRRLLGYPTAGTSRRTRRSPRRDLPAVRAGRDRRARTRFGLMYGATATPTATSREHPPIGDHPCPECGSLLIRRPKSIRCWDCGAELDTEFNVTKSGDPQAEAEARPPRPPPARREPPPRSARRRARHANVRRRRRRPRQEDDAKRTTTARPPPSARPRRRERLPRNGRAAEVRSRRRPWTNRCRRHPSRRRGGRPHRQRRPESPVRSGRCRASPTRSLPCGGRARRRSRTSSPIRRSANC